MGAIWHLIDERNSRGGRLKALVFLTHPGPSLLVTAVTVAAALALSGHGIAPPVIAALVLVVLPAQLATGALNDWADTGADRVDKPFKPIARGAVTRRAALLVALAGFALSLTVAALWGWRYLVIGVLGAGSGIAYDLWLKRTPASVLCWWGGFEAVVLLATTAAGVGGALVTVPLSGVIALALQVSNALPDAAEDRRAGAETLAVVLGPRGSRAVVGAAFLLGAAYALLAEATLHLGQGARWSALLLGIAALAPLTLRPAVLRRAGFGLLAVMTGLAAVSWLAALPPGMAA